MRKCLLLLVAVLTTATFGYGQQRPIPASTYQTISLGQPGFQGTQIYNNLQQYVNHGHNHSGHIHQKYPALQPNIAIPATTEQCKQSVIEQALLQDPAYAAGRERAERQIQDIIADWERGGNVNRAPPVYTIPLVFHVIHKGEALGSGTNLSDAQILSAVDALNRDFRRTAADGGIAQGAGPDTEIQFCLAQRDEFGNPSTGINRVDGTSVSGYASNGITNGNETSVKALSRWDNRYYVNIWVVAEIDNNGADLANPAAWGGGTLGYAYLPTNPVTLNSQRDGIVAVNLCVGNDPQQTNGYRLWPWGGLTNRTLTHEMGHHLNLYHPFVGGSCSETNCNTQGDLVCDTPPTQQGSTCSTPACPATIIENYMDYTGEGCINMFTAGQTTRMRAALTGPRTALTTSNGCTPVNALDIAVTAINTPTGSICDSTFIPEVEVTNYGSTTVTSFDLTYDIDAIGPQVFNWTGTLATSASTTITLPQMNTTFGAHTFNAATSNPNLSTDQNPGNDAMASPFTAIQGNYMTLTVTIDQYGSETTWRVLDGGGVPVATGGPYVDLGGPGTQVYVENFCLPNGCYDLEFNDSYGDGMCCAYGNGGYTLEDDFANVLVTGGTFTNQEVTNFCVPQAPSPPTADFVANVTTIPVGGTVNFTDLSVGNPAITQWDWTFTGGTPNLSNVQNPSGIQYNTAGLYQVSLTVTNAQGNDTETKIDYIDVVPPSGGGACDTFRNYALNETITAYGITNNWGYYPGHNELGWNAYADPYNAVVPTNVTAILLPVLLADDMGTANTFDVVVYNDNSGEPGIPLGTETVNIDQMNPGFFNFIQFTTPVPVSGPFWVGVELTYPATVDTLLLGTAANRAPMGPNTTMVLDGGTWTATDVLFGGGLETSLGIDVLTSGATTSTSFTQSATSICEGETVALDGSGSTNTTAYFWDLVGATPATSSNSTENATYATAGTYDIKLFTQGGCLVDSMITQITVNPAPTVTNSTTDASCGLNDGTITITATGGTPPYQYSIDNGVTWQASNSFTGLAAGNYDILVQDQNGSGCVSAAQTANVNNSNGPSISNSSGTNNSCNASCDGDVTITATGGAPPLQYSIDNGVTWQASNTFTGLCAGTYNIIVEDNNACQVTDVVTITEPAGINHTNSVTNASCGQSNGSISVTASGGNPAYQYSIDGGATWQAGSTFINLAAGNYDVMVMDANSCTSTIITETVGGGSTMNLTSSQNNETCGSANGDATVNVTGGTPGYTYSWSSGGSGATETGLAAGTYTVTVTDQNGCQEVLNVTITNSGGVNGTVSPSTDICSGDTEVLTAGGGTIYTWDDGNGPIGSGSTIAVNPTVTTTYTVIIQDATGCTDTLQTTITVNQYPTTTVSPDVTICDGESVVLTAGGGTTYFWNTTETTASITVSPSSQTTYSVIAYNGSCAGQLETVTVSVDPAPTAMAGANATTVYLNQGATVDFNSTGSFGTSYDWDFGDSQTGSGQSVTHSYGTVGTYMVVLTVTLGNCVDYDTLYIDVLLQSGIGESALGNTINFFPNPSGGIVNMNIDLDQHRDLQVTVYNGIGQVVRMESHNGVQAGQFVFDLSNEAEGFYFFQVTSGEESFTARILLTR